MQVNIEGLEDNQEDHNKRLFVYWMKMQVKPKGDSDAGNPYSEII